MDAPTTTEAEASAEWETPTFEKLDVAKTELGLSVGGDLIIPGTAS